jgi:hypothetical protein
VGVHIADHRPDMGLEWYSVAIGRQDRSHGGDPDHLDNRRRVRQWREHDQVATIDFGGIDLSSGHYDSTDTCRRYGYDCRSSCAREADIS